MKLKIRDARKETKTTPTLLQEIIDAKLQKKIQVLQKELAKTKRLQSDYIKALAKLSDVQMDSETHTLIQELAETSLYINKWEKIIDETKIELGR